MNTKTSLIRRCVSFAKSKKGAALLLLACTVGDGSGGAVGGTGLAIAGVFVGGTAVKIIYDGTQKAAKNVADKQGQSTNAVGGGSAGAGR